MEIPYSLISSSANAVSFDEVCAELKRLLGGGPNDVSIDDVEKAITFTQAMTDILVVVLEKRGAIDTRRGAPVLPYNANFMVHNCLNSDPGPQEH